MELDSPFDLIKGQIQPACLPNNPIKIGTTCYPSGWGDTKKGYPEELMAIGVEIFEREMCPRGIYFAKKAQNCPRRYKFCPSKISTISEIKWS